MYEESLYEERHGSSVAADEEEERYAYNLLHITY